MKTLSQAVLSILIYTCSTYGYGRPAVQRVPNPLIDSLITKGIVEVLLQRYDVAMSVFRRLAEEVPQHPAGYLYQAGVLQAEAMDYEERLNGAEVDSLLVLAKERSDAMIAAAPGSPWGYYYLGSSLGYDSYARAGKGDWFGAATKGMSAASYFEKAIQADSMFFDAFAGLGTYYYWKSRKIEFLTWLPFVEDKRTEGIRLLKECATRGTYNRFAAMSSLIAVLLEARKYDEASAIARQALDFYPENRIFLWGLATALEKTGPPDSAIQAYERLLGSILRDTRPNFYNELVCRLNLLKLKSAAEPDSHFRLELSELLALESVQFPEHLKERAAEKFEIARQLEAVRSRAGRAR